MLKKITKINTISINALIKLTAYFSECLKIVHAARRIYQFQKLCIGLVLVDTFDKCVTFNIVFKMFDEGICIKFLNFILPLFLIQSPWRMKPEITKKHIAFWCVCFIITIHAQLSSVLEILEFKFTSINEVLTSICTLTISMASSYIFFSDQIWRKDDQIIFGENQQHIDRSLKLTQNLKITNNDFSCVVVYLIITTVGTLYSLTIILVYPATIVFSNFVF